MAFKKRDSRQLVRISVRIPAETASAAKAAASRDDLTLSDVYRQIIVEFFSDQGLQNVNSERAS